MNIIQNQLTNLQKTEWAQFRWRACEAVNHFLETVHSNGFSPKQIHLCLANA